MFNVSMIVRDCGNTAVVALRGELDIADAAEVAAALMAAAVGRTETVVDLAGLAFLDCSGVAALVRARTQVRRAGGVLLLASPQRRVLRVIALTGLIDIADIHDSIEDATDMARRAARPPWLSELRATKTA